MTAPNFESIMPYGVTVKSVEGQAYPILPSGPKSRGKTGIMLPDGPCQVMASWGGPDDMRLVLYGEEGVRDSYGKKADLDVIEASPGGRRSTRMVTIGAVPGDWVALRPVTKTTPGYFGTIMVYPLAQL